jgi:hypothetical protein
LKLLDATPEIEEIELKVTDRCDACQAQAFVYLKGVTGELYFCGHHYAKNEEKLQSWAFTIIDARDTINSKPDSSN